MPLASRRQEGYMRRIFLLGLALHLTWAVGQVAAQGGSSSLGGGSGSGLGGSGLGGSSLGGSGLGGGGMGGGPNQLIGNSNGNNSGFGLGFMRLGQSGSARGGGSATGSTSFMGPYYASPLALGYGPLNTGNAQAASSNANPAFGTVFANTASGTTGGRGASGAMGGLGATGSSNLTGSVDFNPVNSSGIKRNLPYAAEVNFEGNFTRSEADQAALIAIAEKRLIDEVGSIVSRSSRLPSASAVVVSMDQGFLVLRGKVGSEKERRVLEAMVRMTPGIREIRNEVQVGQ